MTTTNYQKILQDKYDKLFLTKNELAKELGIHWGTVDRLRRQGYISSVFIGGQVRFPLDEVARYFEKIGA